MKKWFVISVLTAMVTTASVLAQDSTKVTTVKATAAEADEEKDLLELHLFGGFAAPTGTLATFSDSIGAKNGVSLGVEGGYFLTKYLMVGLHFSYYQFDVHRAGDFGKLRHRLFSPRLYLRHTLNMNSNFEPFVKFDIGLENPRLVTFTNSPSGDRYRELSYSPSLSAGISAGLTYYTADYSGPFIEVGYHTAFAKDSKKDYLGTTYKVGGSLGLVDVRLGFRILFGSGE